MQKCANLIESDLEKCFKRNVWLHKSASIRPRTSIPKLGEVGVRARSHGARQPARRTCVGNSRPCRECRTSQQPPCSAQQREGIDDVSAVSPWPDETTMLPVPALAQPCNRDRNLQSQLDYERSHDQNAQKNCCYNLNRKSDVRMKLRI